jgi:hypothetical protein
MGHNVGEAAARSVRKSEKTKLAERTPEQILKDIRNNLAAKLAVTPGDTQFLLDSYDSLKHQWDVLQEDLHSTFIQSTEGPDPIQTDAEGVQSAKTGE